MIDDRGTVRNPLQGTADSYIFLGLHHHVSHAGSVIDQHHEGVSVHLREYQSPCSVPNSSERCGGVHGLGLRGHMQIVMTEGRKEDEVEE